MTTYEQRVRAIERAYVFLHGIAIGTTKRIPKAVRNEAFAILRSYPNALELEIMVLKEKCK